MFDPEKNVIQLTKDGSTEELLRGSAAWKLTILHKFSLDKPTRNVNEQLSTIYAWHGETAFEPGKPNLFGTPKYKNLEDKFCSTFIAWLVKGEELPAAAEGVSGLLKKIYSSPEVVSGADLNPIIASVFQKMLGVDSDIKSVKPTEPKSAPRKAQPPKSTRSKTIGGASRFPFNILHWRTDFLGRLRVVLSPLISLPILNALVYESNDGFFLRGISYVIEAINDGYYGSALAIPIAFLFAWILAGVVELTMKWVAEGRGKQD